MISLAGTELPTYSIGNRLAEHFAIESGGSRLRAPWHRIHYANKFATEAFVDEIARKRGDRPLGLPDCAD